MVPLGCGGAAPATPGWTFKPPSPSGPGERGCLLGSVGGLAPWMGILVPQFFFCPPIPGRLYLPAPSLHLPGGVGMSLGSGDPRAAYIPILFYNLDTLIYNTLTRYTHRDFSCCGPWEAVWLTSSLPGAGTGEKLH